MGRDPAVWDSFRLRIGFDAFPRSQLDFLVTAAGGVGGGPRSPAGREAPALSRGAGA